jgi:phenylacetate-CoA ligase
VNEAEFIAEVLAPGTNDLVKDGELGELVMTNLGRCGAPVVRYRTGDMVRPQWNNAGPQRFLFLEGGVLGRCDDMLVVRGVNIFPSSIDEIVRGFAEVRDYRTTVVRVGALDELRIEVESEAPSASPQLAHRLESRLGLKVGVQAVPVGSLPRSEGGKVQRFLDRRGDIGST